LNQPSKLPSLVPSALPSDIPLKQLPSDLPSLFTFGIPLSHLIEAANLETLEPAIGTEKMLVTPMVPLDIKK
jgi:hypothetical protein